ncbi:hypothetical protein Avbf_04670 [Armadillidium vulgare]|nr:hypothetical protein Avbf_04670 [Armadillidium vulgare]
MNALYILTGKFCICLWVNELLGQVNQWLGGHQNSVVDKPMGIKVGCDGDNCEIYYKRVVSIGIAVPLLFCLLGIIIISSIKLGRTKKIRSSEYRMQ